MPLCNERARDSSVSYAHKLLITARSLGDRGPGRIEWVMFGCRTTFPLATRKWFTRGRSEACVHHNVLVETVRELSLCHTADGLPKVDRSYSRHSGNGVPVIVKVASGQFSVIDRRLDLSWEGRMVSFRTFRAAHEKQSCGVRLLKSTGTRKKWSVLIYVACTGC